MNRIPVRFARVFRAIRAFFDVLWRRRWVRRLPFAGGFLLLMYVVFPWIGYNTVAPAGWHNATVHGSISGIEYAISADDSGVILACGDDIEFSFNPFPSAAVPHCWRTRDGGAHWDVISAPFPFHVAGLEIVAPHAGDDTFFAFQNYLGPAQVPPPQPFWVTHDAGTTWQPVATIPGDASSLFAVLATYSSAIYRDGVLYALQPPKNLDDVVPGTFSWSHDDGHTWTVAETAPSALERAGWKVYSFAADYGAAHAWYRTLAKGGGAPVLEHSSDDGRTWTTVGMIGDLRGADDGSYTFVSLATTPARPAALCAGNDGIWLGASMDGGHTWRGGAWNTAPANIQGYSQSPIQIGSDGTCYHTFNYQVITGEFHSHPWDAPYHDAILQLAPNQPLPSTVAFSDDFRLSLHDLPGVPNWAYVPAGHGMPGRLVVHADNYSLTPINLIRSMLMGVSESRDDFLLWTAVP